MRPRLLLAVLLGLAALGTPTPAGAAVVDCAALTAAQRTQAEALGACSPGAPKAVCLPATDAGIQALVAWLAAQANYQTEVPCEAARRADAHGILVAAGPGDGTCAAELLGQPIPNPQPVRQVALRWWRTQINDQVVSHQTHLAAEAERQRALSETPTPIPEEVEVPPR